MKLIPLAAVLMLAAMLNTAAAQDSPETEAETSTPPTVQETPVPAEPSVIRVGDNPDQIIRLRTRVRHTTVIQLPGRENILDFVVGDSEYWHLTGAAELDPRISPGAHQPAFVARDQVEAYQQMAEQARLTAVAAQTEAEQQIAAVQQQAEGEIDAARQQAEGEINSFRSVYPTRLKFPYRLQDKALKWPFLVQGMWHDGQFTYLRSQAQESPALYEIKDGKPALVAYDLTEDGLYIARHLLGDGWLQIGKEKAQWKLERQELGP